MKKNIVIVAVILVLALFASIYAMSDDGGQLPVKPEKKTESASVQKEQAQQSEMMQSSTEEQSKSNAPVKDWFGFDTGMTEKALQEHQETYIQRWIGLQESIVGVRKNVTEKKMQLLMKRTREDALYMYMRRLNINAIPKFKEFGINLIDYFSGYDAHGVEPYTFATTISQVVIHGIISIGYDSLKHAGYYLKPIEIFKGGFYYEKMPDIIPFNIWGELQDGQEYIVFLGVNSNSKVINQLNKISLENIGVPLWVKEDSQVIDSYRRVLGNIDEVKATIKEIDKVNNTVNFYNIKF